MGYKVKLKTGFFETTLYEISIFDKQIRLSTINTDQKGLIIIANQDLISVTLFNHRHPEIEIQTYDRNIRGTFVQEPDFRDLFYLLKDNFDKEIIYEGGNNKDD